MCLSDLNAVHRPGSGSPGTTWARPRRNPRPSPRPTEITTIRLPPLRQVRLDHAAPCNGIPLPSSRTGGCGSWRCSPRTKREEEVALTSRPASRTACRAGRRSHRRADRAPARSSQREPSTRGGSTRTRPDRRRWATRTPDAGEPYGQLTLISMGVLAIIEPDQARWPLAGDQLYADFDLSEENLPARLDSPPARRSSRSARRRRPVATSSVPASGATPCAGSTRHRHGPPCAGPTHESCVVASSKGHCIRKAAHSDGLAARRSTRRPRLRSCGRRPADLDRGGRCRRTISQIHCPSHEGPRVWGLTHGHANTNAELVTAARAQIAYSVGPSTA